MNMDLNVTQYLVEDRVSTLHRDAARANRNFAHRRPVASGTGIAAMVTAVGTRFGRRAAGPPESAVAASC